jgi:hypothetical protein
MGEKKDRLSQRQKIIIDTALVLAVLYFLGTHMVIYGLNFTDIDNRIAAARAYNDDPLVRNGADIIQIIEDPYADTTTVCGAWKPSHEITHMTPAPCIEYTTRGGYIYGVGRQIA